tara:strand:+ start:25 stop:573 length:549 start_codon:yes stop_codon:yes gene_type:complete
MSTIDDTSIDQTFPVAGQDNNSQGFRDNFSTIKNNFTITKTHIAEVTTNYARKNAANNFSGQEMTGMLMKQNFIKTHSIGSITGASNLSLTNGNFQYATVGGDLTITMLDWSQNTDAMEKVVVQLIQSGGARNVTFATNGGTVKTDFTQPVSIDSAANPKVFEAYTYDKGQTVYVHYVGQFA